MRGKEFRRRRKVLDYSIERMADHLKVHRNTVIKWEKNGVPDYKADYVNAKLLELEGTVLDKKEAFASDMRSRLNSINSSKLEQKVDYLFTKVLALENEISQLRNIVLTK